MTSMTFEVVPDAEHPELLNDGLKYDGMRFRVEGKLAGKIYGERFGTDVVLGEPLLRRARSRDGRRPAGLRRAPATDHARLSARDAPRRKAACLHAAAHRGRIHGSRICRICSASDSSANRRGAPSPVLEQTFAFRNTHPLPAQLPEPLAIWTTAYAAMAREDRLAWATLPDVTEAARQFLDPVLTAEIEAVLGSRRTGGGSVVRQDVQIGTLRTPNTPPLNFRPRLFRSAAAAAACAFDLCDLSA